MIVFNALQVDLDLLACLKLPVEFRFGDDTVALETDVDNDIFLADADHLTRHDLVS